VAHPIEAAIWIGVVGSCVFFGEEHAWEGTPAPWCRTRAARRAGGGTRRAGHGIGSGGRADLRPGAGDSRV
jgi:hypothetical protein